jgi:hypothetical protein
MVKYKFVVYFIFCTLSLQAQNYKFGSNKFAISDSVAEFKNDTTVANFYFKNNSIDSSTVKIGSRLYNFYFVNRKLDSIAVKGRYGIKIVDNKTILFKTYCGGYIKLNNQENNNYKYLCDSIYFKIVYNNDNTINEFFCVDKLALHNLCLLNVPSSIYNYQLFFRPNDAIDIPVSYITPVYNINNQMLLTQFYISKRGKRNFNSVGFSVYYGPTYNDKPFIEIRNKRGKVISN